MDRHQMYKIYQQKVKEAEEAERHKKEQENGKTVVVKGQKFVQSPKTTTEQPKEK